jgi:phospholipid/cholesterol/gamma-HCH transport system substrate-binding protein
VSRSLSRWQAALLGLVVVAGLGGAIVALFAVGGRYSPWSDTFDIRVGFRQVRGVEVGTRVRVQGVDAGEVVALDPPQTPGGNVLLTLRLDNHRLRARNLVRADAVAQILGEGMVGGKVIEIDPGTGAAPAVHPGDEIASRSTVELGDAMAQAGNLLDSLNNEKGKLAEVVDNANRLLQKGQDAVASIQRVSEGLEDAPLLRDYVKDPQKVLFPPNCERKPWWFADGELFDPGTDKLTNEGRQKLNDLVQMVSGLTRHEGAEVVVVAFADRRLADQNQARRLTQNQSQNVSAYLQERGAIYKKYWVWSRKVTPLGLGTERPPVPEKEKLPPAGVGVLVFVPQG